jgi:oxygen-dependent protoporphyrinogen oxidase
LALAQQLERHPGLFLTGNAYFGVGLNDCVHAANQVAERAVGLLRKRAGI